MPFYEYECQSCKHYLEVMQKITEAPLTKCPSCGRKTLIKLISAPVFRLKGSGWYETDFKSDQENKRNIAAAEREESKPAASAEGDKSPAKAAEGAVKTAEAKPESKVAAASPAPGRHRASPVARKSPGSGARAAARPRSKAATAKGAGKARSKR